LAEKLVRYILRLDRILVVVALLAQLFTVPLDDLRLWICPVTHPAALGSLLKVLYGVVFPFLQEPGFRLMRFINHLFDDTAIDCDVKHWFITSFLWAKAVLSLGIPTACKNLRVKAAPGEMMGERMKLEF